MCARRSDVSASSSASACFSRAFARAAASCSASPLRSFVLAASRVTTSSSPFRSRSSRSRPTRAFTAALCAHSRLRTRVRVALSSRSIRLRSSASTRSAPLLPPYVATFEYVPLTPGFDDDDRTLFSVFEHLPGSKVRSARRSALTRRTSCIVRRWWSALAPTEKSPPPPPPRSRLRPSGRSKRASAPSTRSASGSAARGDGLAVSEMGESPALSASAVRSCLFLADGVTHRSTRSGSTPLARSAARLTTSRDSVRRSLGRGGHRVLYTPGPPGMPSSTSAGSRVCAGIARNGTDGEDATRAPKAGRSRWPRRRPTIAAARERRCEALFGRPARFGDAVRACVRAMDARLPCAARLWISNDATRKPKVAVRSPDSATGSSRTARQLGHSWRRLADSDLALALDEQNFARVSVPSRARDAEGLAR